MKKTLVTLALVAAFGATAFSQPPAKASKVEKRLARQDAHIQKGIQKGKLTPEEVTQLQSSRAKIQNDVSTARSDGSVTKEEREQIKQELKLRSKEIKALRHN